MEDKTKERIFFSLPRGISTEIERLAEGRGGVNCIAEIRLRLVGESSIVIAGERVRLFSSVCEEDIARCVEMLTDGALYSHRDTVCRGYISLEGGVRVGVCGKARYDREHLVGVSDVTSLIYRIPTVEFGPSKELARVFAESKRGVLIYSSPGAGKTSALRALAREAALLGEEVAVIDERCEFSSEHYRGLSVDVLHGYRRAEGIEIALRTLSPSVIMVDEVGRLCEAESLLESLSSGVKVVLSAHAASLSEVRRRITLRPFFEHGVVDKLVGIEVKDGARSISVWEA